MRALLVLCLSLAGCTKSEGVATPREQEPPVAEKPEPEKPEPEPEPVTKPRARSQCIAVLSLDSDDSVLAEQRARAGAERWSDFAEAYPAAYIDPETHHPVERVASYRIGDTPLLWFTPDYSGAVVNAAVLGDLKAVDATGLGPEQRHELGSLGELGQGKIGGRELLEFMLKAGVIGTYVHIGSTLCLLSETEDEQGYRARFTGRHVFFTNEENVERFGFVFEFGPAGAMAVTGAPAEEFSTLSQISTTAEEE